MIKSIIYLALLVAFIYVGATVKLGKRTFFGHVRAIWHTEEVQDLKDGVEDKAKPAVDRVKKGVSAAMKDDDTAWIQLDALGVEVEAPACWRGTVRSLTPSAVAIGTNKRDGGCPALNVMVGNAPARESLDEAIVQLGKLDPAQQIVAKETTANGWVFETVSGAYRRITREATIDGRTILCANTGTGNDDFALARRVCASMRAIAR